VGLHLQENAALILGGQASGGDAVHNPAQQLTTNPFIAANIAELLTGQRVVFKHPCGCSPIIRDGTSNRVSQAGGVVGIVPTSGNAGNHAEQEGITAGFRLRRGRGLSSAIHHGGHLLKVPVDADCSHSPQQQPRLDA
jgi:hypothetical protein